MIFFVVYLCGIGEELARATELKFAMRVEHLAATKKF